MNHKWKDNVCEKCGLHRMMRDYKKLLRTYTALGKDGCWYDKPVYYYGRTWYYGMPLNKSDVAVYGLGFDRPDCNREKILSVVENTLKQHRLEIINAHPEWDLSKTNVASA